MIGALNQLEREARGAPEQARSSMFSAAAEPADFMSAAPCMPSGAGAFPNSVVASPNGDGLILDLAYSPFMHGAPGPFDYKTWNARLGLQFTWYLHLFGGTNNFDGSFLGGTHNASGNNSIFAYAWLAF